MSDRPMPRCCNMTSRHKAVFDVVFDRMPWLYPVFFEEQSLGEHDLATFLDLLSSFLTEKLRAQRKQIVQAIRPILEAVRGCARQRHIEEQAFYLWEKAGKPGGDGKDFWLQAEKEHEAVLSELVSAVEYGK